MTRELTKTSAIDTGVGRARREANRLVGALYDECFDWSIELRTGSKLVCRPCWDRFGADWDLGGGMGWQAS